uniref:FATP synthase c subunit lysine N-methyltransferase n=1 Tax=Cyprinus carpio TaxID=7962 RepID=A0A8C2LAS7_CYPCA
MLADESRCFHFRMSDFGKESNPSTETCKQGSAGERGFKKRLGIIACVVGGSLVSLYAVTAPFVAPALRKVCLPCTWSLVDIGSGDGRIKAWREGVHHNTSFYISDLWKVSFSEYSNVVIFGEPQMMEQLEVKLRTELQSSAKAVACKGIDTVWVYNAKTFKPPIKNDKDSERLEQATN